MVPLRSYSKLLYEVMKEELLVSNIHSYDVRPFVDEVSEGVHIHLFYGEDYAHESKGLFTAEQVNQIDEEVKQFFNEIGKKCQEVMIADYFKMMKP